MSTDTSVHSVSLAEGRTAQVDENGVVGHIDLEVGNPLVVGDDDR